MSQNSPNTYHAFITNIERQIDGFYNRAKAYIADEKYSEFEMTLRNNKDIKQLQDEILIFRKDFETTINIRIHIKYTDSVYRQYSNNATNAKKRMRNNFNKKKDVINHIIYELLDRISRRRIAITQYIGITQPSGETVIAASSVGGSKKRKSLNKK